MQYHVIVIVMLEKIFAEAIMQRKHALLRYVIIVSKLLFLIQFALLVVFIRAKLF